MNQKEMVELFYRNLLRNLLSLLEVGMITEETTTKELIEICKERSNINEPLQ